MSDFSGLLRRLVKAERQKVPPIAVPKAGTSMTQAMKARVFNSEQIERVTFCLLVEQERHTSSGTEVLLAFAFFEPGTEEKLVDIDRQWVSINSTIQLAGLEKPFQITIT
jgi:hypothetical protein